MDIVERYEADYEIAEKRGARPELLSKMTEQIGKLKIRTFREDKGQERMEPEEVYLPPEEEISQPELEFGDEITPELPVSEPEDDDLPPF